MNCKGCGNEIDHESLFCKKCGFKVTNENKGEGQINDNTITINKKVKHKYLFLAGTIVITLCIIVGGMYFTGLICGSPLKGVGNGIYKSGVEVMNELDKVIQSKNFSEEYKNVDEKMKAFNNKVEANKLNENEIIYKDAIIGVSQYVGAYSSMQKLVDNLQGDSKDKITDLFHKTYIDTKKIIESKNIEAIKDMVEREKSNINNKSQAIKENKIAIEVTKVTNLLGCVRIYMVIKNTSNESVFVSPLDFTLSITNGNTYNSHMDSSIDSITLQSQQQTEGFVQFAIYSPQGIQALNYNGINEIQQLSVNIPISE